MAIKTVLVIVCAASFLGFTVASSHAQRHALEAGMQPDVVAKTLSNVQQEWKAQAAIFSDCDSAAKSPGGPIVNCKDAKSSFTKSCDTIGKAIVQGSGGDRAIMNEYMADVCSQRVMSGWHQSQCKAIALGMSAAMSADRYQNRIGFNSASLCGKLWEQLLEARKLEVTQEKAEREAAEKKAALDEAEDERVRLEAQKKEAEHKKAEEAERAKQEAAARAAEAKAKAAEAEAEAKAKAAEAAERVAKKRAEAEAVAAAAKQKLAEVKAAEEAAKAKAAKHTEGTQKAPEDKAQPSAKLASNDKAHLDDAKNLDIANHTAGTQKTSEAKAQPAANLVSNNKVAKKIAEGANNFVIAAAASAPAAAEPAKDKGAAAGSKGAKGAEDLNAKMPLKAQEQGFTGSKVKHEDGKTSVKDWQNEYASKGTSFLAPPAGRAAIAA